MRGLLRTRLARITPEQQRFLAAMAAVGDGPVERAAIAAELGVATTVVIRPRQQLIDWGYIESVGHGTPQAAVHHPRVRGLHPHPWLNHRPCARDTLRTCSCRGGRGTDAGRVDSQLIWAGRRHRHSVP